VRKVTVSMSDDLVKRSREYARKRGTTLNQLVRDLLEREMDSPQGETLEAMFAAAHRMGVRSNRSSHTREEAHERR